MPNIPKLPNNANFYNKESHHKHVDCDGWWFRLITTLY